jgi:hypothetical protein
MMPVFKSSRSEAWAIPGVAILIGILLIVAGVSSLRAHYRWFGWCLLGVGVHNLVFVVRTWGQFRALTVAPEGVTIEQRGARQLLRWHEVRDCSTVRFGPFIGSYPATIYRLRSLRPDLVSYFLPGRVAPQASDRPDQHPQSMLEFIHAQLGSQVQ